jgi:uncharacterized membrane-anchored protein
MLARAIAAIAATVLLAPVAAAQDDSTFARFNFDEGPITGRLGLVAAVDVPEHCRFTEAKGAQNFLEATQNPPSGKELGLVLCKAGVADTSYWFVVFTFDESGYVKDDEKKDLDADKILKSIQEGTEAGNAARRNRGWEELQVTGWERPPYYDSLTHNLTWSTRLRGKQTPGESINHSVRLLGRRGVMHVDLVADPADMSVAVAAFDSLIGSYTYLSGNKYAEWQKGDKIAKYGLTALIAGGAAAAAFNLGFFGKMWKVILAVILALKKLIIVVFAAAATFFKRIFGKKTPKPDTAAAPAAAPPVRAPREAYKPTPGSPLAKAAPVPPSPASPPPPSSPPPGGTPQ